MLGSGAEAICGPLQNGATAVSPADRVYVVERFAFIYPTVK
jgi:hypothetical protein